MPPLAWAAVGLIIVVAASVAGYGAAYRKGTRSARDHAKNIAKEAGKARALASREVEALRKELIAEAKDEALRLKQEADAESRQKRAELTRVEERLAHKEQALESRADSLAARDRDMQVREAQMAARGEKAEQVLRERERELERVANLPAAQAREELMKSVRDAAEQDIARMLRDLHERAQDEADRRARNIVSLAISRCAVDQAAESTVCVVPLPSDEMKGRIIGREGRNIRSFETLTGVDLIIDDTPEAVVLSAFDAVRRETARLALTALVADGRIHPGRIEEAVEKARARVESEALLAAESAVLDVGAVGLSSETMRYLGRLRFRTSYGQNCLDHSREVAHLAGFMAAELGADVAVAKKGGLLHDIGKGVDTEYDGPHALIGQELCRKAGESLAVQHVVAAHHEDVTAETIEAALVQAADAVSAARPGARRETLENYIKRLRKLETIGDSFSGVEKTYAIQAGREIRVMVKPEEVDDNTAVMLARETARRIAEEMEYPGQIKVTVIRETRAVDYAK